MDIIPIKLYCNVEITHSNVHTYLGKRHYPINEPHKGCNHSIHQLLRLSIRKNVKDIQVGVAGSSFQFRTKKIVMLTSRINRFSPL